MKKPSSGEKTLANRLVVFDFDGTITRKDSLMEFIRFSHGTAKLYLSLLMFSPLLVLMYAGLLSRSRVKEQLLSFLYKNSTKQQLRDWSRQFCEQSFNALLHVEATRRIEVHQKAGDEVVIVTASPGLWVRPFARRLGVGLIATELQFRDQVFTGRFATRNCRGPEKVERLREQFEISGYKSIIVYGDSEGDHALYEIADQYFNRLFKN